ncbi:MAG TPA: permease-like cell division protein FtsX [Ignavibacteriaceae bacterium]|nr:permease-like cell division protein FtsX [Ignavibacteriaceae bacterium]
MFFIIKEAFKLIGRAKASFILSLISLSISVILITASVMLIQASDYLQKKIKEDININLFLSDNLPREQIRGIKEILMNRPYVKSVQFISKDEAAEIFKQETGEDFNKLLEYNPLPASYSIRLRENYFQKDTLNQIINSLSEIPGIDDISFSDEYIFNMISTLNDVKKYVFIITLIIFIISIYIVYSTVKLIVSSRFEELETMKLVGARLFTIKMPVILNSMISGTLAGLIAVGFFILFMSLIDNYISKINFLGTGGYFYLVFALILGPVLGFFVSIISLRKLTLKI